MKEPGIGLVGCGHRGIIGFLNTLKSIEKADRVVALYDNNPSRMAFAHSFLDQEKCRKHTSFESFLQDDQMDTVIVATPDHTHVDFVVPSLNAEKNVICEKPIATNLSDAKKMQAVRNDHDLRIAFNLRYSPLMKRTKEILKSGAIGQVKNIEIRDILGYQHGSDYFRRWHRFQDKSGGLLVHKGTHSFDIANWFFEDQPEKVFARASLSYYTPEKQKGERCLSCNAKAECPFYIDLNADVPGQEAGVDKFYQKMYLEAESHDGYIRDACVFHKDNTIHDTYHISVGYRGGGMLQYSSLFYAPFEDRQFVIQGDKGRLECSKAKNQIRLQGIGSSEEEVLDIPVGSGGHGGADVNLMRSLFECEAASDLQQAGWDDGYWSLAIADGANRSIASEREIILEK